MATLREIAATQQVVTDVAFRKALEELKVYIDAHGGDYSSEIDAINERLNTLIGEDESGQSVDVTTAIDTFNEIKDFLAGIEDTTLAGLITTINNAIDGKASKATTLAGYGITNAYTKTESDAITDAISARVTTLENVEVMTAAQAEELFDSIFNPTVEEENNEQVEP